MLQNSSQSLPQFFQLHARQSSRFAPRTDSGSEQAFIRVDVAHARQQRLIQKSCLDRQLPPAKQLSKLLGRNRKRLRSGTREAIAFCPRSRNSSLPNRRGSTKRNSRPLASVSRACVCFATGASGVVTSRRPVMPRCTIHCAAMPFCSAGRSPLAAVSDCELQFNDNMLAGAMDRENPALPQSRGLPAGRVLEGFAMRPEPRIHNPVSAHARIHAACDRFHFGQFRHRLILVGRGRARESSSCEASKRRNHKTVADRRTESGRNE